MVMLLIGTGGCAATATDAPGDYFQDYQATQPDLGSPSEVPPAPDYDSAHDGQACFAESTMDRWFGFRDLAKSHGTLAEENRAAAQELAGERDDLVEMGRKTEQQAQALSRELRRCEVRAKVFGWTGALWFVLGAFIGSQ